MKQVINIPEARAGVINSGLQNVSQVITLLLAGQVGGFLFDRVDYWVPFALKGAADLACGIWIVAVRKRVEKSKAE